MQCPINRRTTNADSPSRDNVADGTRPHADNRNAPSSGDNDSPPLNAIDARRFALPGESPPGPPLPSNVGIPA